MKKRENAMGELDADFDGLYDEADEDDQIKWLNYYKCTECGTEWTDAWSCQCNDRCPKCDIETEPYDSKELDNFD